MEKKQKQLLGLRDEKEVKMRLSERRRKALHPHKKIK